MVADHVTIFLLKNNILIFTPPLHFTSFSMQQEILELLHLLGDDGTRKEQDLEQQPHIKSVKL